MKRPWPAHLIAVLVLAMAVAGVATDFWRANAGWGLVGFLLVTLAVGWFLAVRLPSNVLGWLLMAVPAIVAVHVPLGLLGRALLPTAPDAAAWLLWFAHNRADLDSWSWILSVGLMLTQIPLRFPSGRLPSPRWRWFSWYSIAAVLLAAAIQSTYTIEAFPGVPSPAHISISIGPIAGQFFGTAFLFSSAVAGSLASLIVRYRGGGQAVRAQIRWMAWAVVLSTVALSVDAFAPLEWTVLHEWILLALALVPVSIMIAVLRYRLFEIDRIISRTVSYTIVTALAVGVYALVVTSVTWLLPAAPAIAVAGATLAAAAVFLPVFRGVQQRVDRRFDRERYDAARIVDEFGERLRVGNDPLTSVADLTDVVERALQPSAVGLWTARSE